MPSPVQMKTLLEAGVHFGHQTRRWDPRMKPFIFTERNGIHIIDLQQTVKKLEEAMNFVRQLAANGGVVLFVGTKKQAQETIEEESRRATMPFVSQRWMGGMLTNFQTIKSRVERLKDLELRRDRGDFERLPKKEAAKLTDEMTKLQRLLGGIRDLQRLPQAVFIVDPHREDIAVREARRMEIPIVAMVDTNCNPDLIDHPVPANDDAIRAIRLLTSKVADAAIEGRQQRESALAAEEEAEEEPAEAEPEVVEVGAFADVEAEMLRQAGEPVAAGEAELPVAVELADSELASAVALDPQLAAQLAPAAAPAAAEAAAGRRPRRRPRRKPGGGEVEDEVVE